MSWSQTDELANHPLWSQGRMVGFSGNPQLVGEKAADAELAVLTDEYTGRGQGFSLTTHQRPPRHYDIEVRWLINEDVRKGDTYFVSFWMRATRSRYETGEVVSNFRLQRVTSPWERFVAGEITAASEWRHFYRAARANADIPAGQIAAIFSGGYAPQSFEVAGLRVVNLGPEVAPESLPMNEETYAGASPDAPWRVIAAKHIDLLRKANLAIQVMDSQGRAVTHAKVQVRQTRHAFWFGTAIAADFLWNHWDTPDGIKYRQTVEQWFTGASIENHLKWERWEADPQIALKSLHWLQQASIPVHGHVLIWPGVEKLRIPDGKVLLEKARQGDPQPLRRRIDSHFENILKGTDGLVDAWDVINETYTQREVIDALGKSEMVHWFRLARQLSPTTRLCYNDFGILGALGLNKPHQDHVYDVVKYLLDEQAPIDAIGFQSHMGQGMTPPHRLLDILDRFAGLGLKILITEFDNSIPNPALQEQYTRDFMTVIFSHPAVEGFTTWGFWAGAMWEKRSAMFDRQWNLMPVGKAYEDMVFRQWWTDTQASTDAQGQALVRGFKGDYQITVTHGSHVTTQALRLHEDTALEVRLP